MIFWPRQGPDLFDVVFLRKGGVNRRRERIRPKIKHGVGPKSDIAQTIVTSHWQFPKPLERDVAGSTEKHVVSTGKLLRNAFQVTSTQLAGTALARYPPDIHLDCAKTSRWQEAAGGFCSFASISFMSTDGRKEP